MARDAISLSIPDLSDFAKRLRRDIQGAGQVPSHLSLLNMLARAAGFGNYQHLRVAPAIAPPTPTPVDEKRLARAVRLFDSEGRLTRWPNRTSLQDLCLWVLWSHLPARQVMSEPEVNQLIDRWHLFGDRAILRRSLIGHRLAERTADGREYRRIERAPTAEARALLRCIPRGRAD
ncbi:DUF2087 domain-containing protein [Frigidibacter sp. RF13]|uniref:DUF2087 domain-containing protein n=1 Tax=Frigidibacter sp. RF13 TaxID=2997340 RepID=UPI00226F6CE3|nr:DUF2087 domain-containing protein [Frigidibacter sp. RF13]MCY1127860.1 DUF2087 domain-containing protein [Frigidibacter sp. RF13]